MGARFFVDETDLWLGKLLASQHDNVVYPGHSDLPEVPRGALDDEWLPIIGRLELVVITRDQKMRYRSGEKRVWVNHKVRGFVLTGRKSQSMANSTGIIEQHWNVMNDLAEREREGPWMRVVTAAGLRLVELI